MEQGVEVIEVDSSGLLNEFIKFPFKIYKSLPNWVPPLLMDELETFNPQNMI